VFEIIPAGSGIPHTRSKARHPRCNLLAQRQRRNVVITAVLRTECNRRGACERVEALAERGANAGVAPGISLAGAIPVTTWRCCGMNVRIAIRRISACAIIWLIRFSRQNLPLAILRAACTRANSLSG
jgi:hypothetical protein